MMKSTNKILFGIFCMLTAFVSLFFLFFIISVGDESALIIFASLVSIVFFIYGLCYGISGIVESRKEQDK